MAFAVDDRTVYSGGDDQMIRCWDAATGELKGTYQGHTGRIWGLAVSPDGRTLASAGGDGTVKLWDPAPTRDHDTILIEEPLAAWRFSRDGKALATLDLEGRLSIRESDTGRLVRSRPLGPLAGSGVVIRQPITAAAISGDLRTVLLADAAGTVTAWDGESGGSRATLGEAHGPSLWIGVTADGTHGYIARDGRAEYWDLRTAHRAGVLEGRFAPDWRHRGVDRPLMCDRGRGGPVIWDPSQGRVTRAPAAIRFIPRCTAFSPDGRLLAYSNEYEGLDHRVNLITTDRLEERPSPIVSPEDLSSLAFDPTGRILAGGCADHRVRLWDLASGETLLTLEGHSGPVGWAHFLPDGRTLASLAGRPGGGAEVFLWRTSEGGADRASRDPDRGRRPAE